MTVTRSIVQYTPTEKDHAMKNPFLEEVTSLLQSATSPAEGARRLTEERARLVMKYAFTIPYHDIIKEIAAHGPLVEIGAGNGYWAWMLSQAGADVAAIDLFSPDEVEAWDFTGMNQWYDDSWYFIDQGPAESAGGWPERSLFLAWPLYADPMAIIALDAYENAGGHTVIFLGDASMAGDENFHRKLASLLPVKRIDCMGWPGLHEELVIASLV